MRFVFPALGLAFLVLVALKLTHVADLSWWAVTGPLWIALGITIGFIVDWYRGQRP